MNNSKAARVAFLSFRPFAGDFRRYLMQALHAAGWPCAHVLLKRGAMEMRTSTDIASPMPLAGIGDATHRLRQFFAPGRGIIINSAGNSAPDIILRLWAGLRDDIWIYDVFDRLLYDAARAKRLRWWLTDRAYRAIAAKICLLSPELRSDYPNGFHLDNASHLTPPGHAKIFDGRVVVTASFDRRTDFAFLFALAQAMPDLIIDLYGTVYDRDPSTVSAIDRLTSTHGNVRYRGGFAMDRIGQILDGYAVGLVPYRANDVMTQFINPDKLFHYLCAGLEVIATPIPATVRFRSYVHEVSDAGAAVAALHRIRDEGERRNPGGLHEIFNWNVRAREFSDFVRPCLVPASSANRQRQSSVA